MSPAPAQLFSGLLTCGSDGDTLERGTSGRSGDRRHVYRCPTCGLSVTAQAVEDIVIERALRQLISNDFRRALHDTTTETVAALNARIDAIDTQIAALQRQRDDLTATIARAERLNRIREHSTTLSGPWHTLPPALQRDVLEAVLKHVTVHPASKRGRVFDRDRVTIDPWP